MAVKTADTKSLNIVKQLATYSTLIGTPEVAALLGKSTKSVWRRAKAGSIPHLRFGYTILFDPQQLIEWIEKHRVG